MEGKYTVEEKKYGLLGKSLGHSYSKEIHQLIGAYSFGMWEKTSKELAEFLQERNFDGAMVTIPYKEAVLDFVSEMAPEVALLRSANLLVKGENGVLTAHNTDLFGFMYMIRRAGISLSGKKVLVLGDGATGRTVVHGVEKLGAAQVRVASRRPKGQVEDNLEKVSYDQGWPQAEIVINSTPVGMFPKNGESLVSLDDFSSLEAVFDVIYNPLATSLLLQGRDRGLVTGNGLSMLVAQAVRGAEIFLDGKLPQGKKGEEWIEEILSILTDKLLNLVLIGMPGSGKTTRGKALAIASGKTWVDTDSLIEQRAGKTIPQIFLEGGEGLFRHWEGEVAEEFGKKTGQVIATGGGMVLQQKAMDALRQNGKVIWVKRPLEELARDGRPLSKDLATLEEMARHREPLYRKYSEETLSWQKEKGEEK